MTHKPSHEVELYREGDTYVVLVELPGYDRRDIELRWRDGSLTIDAERTAADTPSRVVHRSVDVPRAVAADDITARYREGVLEVRLPVAGSGEREGKRIDIE